MVRRSRCVVLVALVATVLSLPALAHARAAPGWPDELQPIVDEVEDIRGLEFDHVVPVLFLPDRRFDRRIRTLNSDDDFQARSAIDRQRRILGALGLIDPGVDLVQLLDAGSTLELAGLFTGREVLIRGDQLDVATEPTVAHELVHVLQSQHLSPAPPIDDLAARMLVALREGEANWVAVRYVERLAPARRTRFLRLARTAAREADAEVLTTDVPEVTLLSAFEQYVLGEQLVAATVATSGLQGLDRLWDEPPTGDASLLDVRRDPSAASRPISFTDEHRPRSGPTFQLGAFDTFVLLAAHLRPLNSLDVADDWAGDAAELYTSERLDCVRLAFAARNQAEMVTITYAWREWADAAGATEPFGHDRFLQTSRCTSAPAPAVARGRLWTAAKLVAFRNDLSVRGLEHGLSARDLDCVARAYLVDDAELVELLRPRPLGEALPAKVFRAAMERRRTSAVELCDVKLAPAIFGGAATGPVSPRRS